MVAAVIWLYIVVALVVIGVGLLAAVGGFSGLDEDDELAGAGPHRIPLQLFGYRRDVVDRLLEQLPVAEDE